MNAPHSPSLLSGIQMAPRDPILGLTEAFNADRNPKKVNLGVGVYYDDEGEVPLLECVRRAERQLVGQAAPRNYLPIDGLPAYDRAVRELVFGADSAALKEGRIITVQALGGTGGLKIGADFLRRIAPEAQAWISDPSWENHRGLFENAGFTVRTYPYYDAKTHGLDFDGMIGAIRAMPAGSIVVLQSGDEAERVLSQLKRVVRTNYSNPPTYGGRVVATVLTTPELRSLWERELGHMRARMPNADFSFVERQRGMFSYSGLSRAQVVRLREEFAVYMIESGRICVAALNTKNIDYVADCVARVIG